MHDIILYARGGQNEELRHAVRTWCKNLEFGKLCAVGGPFPQWFKPDILIENPTKYPIMEQCYQNLILALSREGLSEDVIIMMDDVFLLRSVGQWRENGNRGTLLEQAARMKEHTNYTQLLEDTDKELKRLNLPTLSFEEHAPFLCNRKQLLGLLTGYGRKKFANLLWRSLYGNIYAIPTHYRTDIKLSMRTSVLLNDTIISTNEQSWAGAAGVALRDWFPVPSKYEK